MYIYIFYNIIITIIIFLIVLVFNLIIYVFFKYYHDYYCFKNYYYCYCYCYQYYFIIINITMCIYIYMSLFDRGVPLKSMVDYHCSIKLRLGGMKLFSDIPVIYIYIQSSWEFSLKTWGLDVLKKLHFLKDSLAGNPVSFFKMYIVVLTVSYSLRGLPGKILGTCFLICSSMFLGLCVK